MTTTPPGWYDDGHGAVRWWDGARWTEHAQPAAPQHPSAVSTTPAAPGWQPASPPSGGRSKLWILWLVLGLLALGAVVTALFAIPAVLSLVGGSGAVAPGDDDERAAVAAVELHDTAWNTADCALYEEATTENFRGTGGFPDCDDFVAEAEYFTATTDDYRLVVTDVSREGDAIVVETSETFDSFVDESGEELAEPQGIVNEYIYTVVEEDGAWRVDAWE